jgi:hypothetical protein
MADCGKEAGILEYLGVCICNNSALPPWKLARQKIGFSAKSHLSLQQSISQSVQSHTDEREGERCSIDKGLACNKTKAVGVNIPDSSAMLPWMSLQG